MSLRDELKKKSFLVAGNPQYGIAKAIFERWPHARFASRRSGFDLVTQEGRHKLAQQSLEAEIFICCSALSRFSQTMVLETVWTLWQERGKSGQIICLGSTADVGVRPSNWIYPVEKKALRSLCENLCQCTMRGNGILVTYLSMGYVETPKAVEKHPGKKMLKPDYAVDLIEWILCQPPGVNVNSISVDPVQPAPT